MEQEQNAPSIVEHSELRFGTTPNILTMIRIGFVPVVIGCLFIEKPLWDVLAAVFFIIASITDFFDGYIARKQQSVTIYGKLLDPLADKFLVSASLIMLLQTHRIHPVVVILLICREIAITGLRALASAEGVIISASDSAKLKTATQMSAIPCIMIFQPVFGIPVYEIGLGLLYISLAISLWSAKDYIVGFFKGVKEKHLQRREIKRARKIAQKIAKAARKTAKKAAREAKRAAKN